MNRPTAEPLSLEALTAMCEASPFIRFAGIRPTLVDVALQRSTWHMAWRPEFERDAGSGQWQGGPIASFIDTAGCMGLIAVTGRLAGTVDLRTDYLRPASGAYLTAVATVRRAGRTMGVVDVDVLDPQERLVATGRGTFFVEQAR